jgi:hypothetical protein
MTSFIRLRKSQRIITLIRSLKKGVYFLQDTAFISFCTIQNIFKLKEIYKKDTIFVSAASEEYFNYLLNLLESISKFRFNKVVVYDLGLNEDQVLQLKKESYIDLRKFDFDKFPSFVSERQESNQGKIGAYSWKAAIIHEVVNEYKTQVLWLDSANTLTKQFIFTRIALSKLGYFSTYSIDTVEKWTHYSVIDILKINAKILKKINLNAAIIGFDYNNKISKKLLDEWYQYCLQKDLISPVGSNKNNHRWDQSLLSIVFYSNNLKFIPKINEFYGVKTHQWKDRIYFIAKTENESAIVLRSDWYKQFGNISTNTFKNAEKIIFLNVESFTKFSKKKLASKKSYIILENQIDMEEENWSRLIKSGLKISFLIPEHLDHSFVPLNIEFKKYAKKSVSEIMTKVNFLN